MENDLISRQAAIDAIEEYADRLQMVNWKENPNVPYKVHSLNWCINTIRDLPSAQPEQKNQKTALSVQVKVDFDDMKALLEDIGNLQTYKLSEGDDMVLADIEDIECILAKHVKAKEVQPERKKGHWHDCWCSECGWTFEVESGFVGDPTRFRFCPNCGADMRGKQDG